MKLNKIHREVIQEMLERLPDCDSVECYLCILLFDVIRNRIKKESTVWYSFFVPWRSVRVQKRWFAIHSELSNAIKSGIRRKTTLGEWYEQQASLHGVNEHKSLIRKNSGLYTLVRLAWLERALYTGELK